jgi:hypothetical protein
MQKSTNNVGHEGESGLEECLGRSQLPCLVDYPI